MGGESPNMIPRKLGIVHLLQGKSPAFNCCIVHRERLLGGKDTGNREDNSRGLEGGRGYRPPGRDSASSNTRGSIVPHACGRITVGSRFVGGRQQQKNKIYRFIGIRAE